LNKKIIVSILGILAAAMITTPVMAIGPENAENNPWRVVALGGTNVQLWLPSGVMNEWIENPILPGPLRVQVKDAAKFQIAKAIVASSVPEVLFSDNQWFYLDQAIFMALLGAVGADPAIGLGYSEGAYMKIVSVGW